MKRRCAWTGQHFDSVKRGGQEKVFVDDHARAAAHKAARQYTIAMIEAGLLSWEQVRRWAAAQRPPYTAQPDASSDPS